MEKKIIIFIPRQKECVRGYTGIYKIYKMNSENK